MFLNPRKYNLSQDPTRAIPNFTLPLFWFSLLVTEKRKKKTKRQIRTPAPGARHGASGTQDRLNTQSCAAKTCSAQHGANWQPPASPCCCQTPDLAPSAIWQDVQILIWRQFFNNLHNVCRTRKRTINQETLKLKSPFSLPYLFLYSHKSMTLLQFKLKTKGLKSKNRNFNQKLKNFFNRSNCS